MKNLKSFVLGLMLLVGATAHAGDRLKTDIVDTAVANGNFKTLVTAVAAASLVDTLKSEGPFTVFAPLDSAFAKLPAGTIEALLKDIPALANILTYHVVAGEFSLRQLLKSSSIKTVQGQGLKVMRNAHGNLFVNKSKILAKLKVKNGVIYVIDTVLLP